MRGLPELANRNASEPYRCDDRESTYLAEVGSPEPKLSYSSGARLGHVRPAHDTGAKEPVVTLHRTSFLAPVPRPRFPNYYRCQMG